MIRITKGNAPAKLESNNCRNRVETNVQNKEFKGSYYNDASVLAQLEEIHFGKCSFCETKIRPVDTPQVEHYRPKNQLKDDASHIGYYWLGHEWENLLLACPACNKAKSSKFPIEGVRVISPNILASGKLDRAFCKPNVSPLADEKPFLINPEIEDPDPHFRFYPNGRIEGLSARGVESIKICNLNRDSLDLDRKKVIDDFLETLDTPFAGFVEGLIDAEALIFFITRAIERIKKAIRAESKYMLLRKYSFDHFEEFFVSQVEDARKDNLRQAFQSV